MTPRLRRAGLAVAAVLAVPTPVAHAVTGDTSLMSRAGGQAGAKGDRGSAVASISGDGRFVAFMSSASNLHPDDGDSETDVFVRDRFTNATILISRAGGVAGEKGDATGWGSSYPALSSDGTAVAFASTATNLAPDDGDREQDVYARGVYGTKTILVSRASGAAGKKANGYSKPQSISADGRFVVFVSTATNLDRSDPDPALDVYVRDLRANTTTLVSRASGAAGVHGNGASGQGSISADGRLVAFVSRATNLSSEDKNQRPDVYVRDLQAMTTTLVSRASGASNEPSLSGDGRYVAYSNGADIYVRDLQAKTTTPLPRAAGTSSSPSLSADGRRVAFVSAADGVAHVFVHDRTTHSTTLVSRASGLLGAPGNDISLFPAISADGRGVAFDSNATNLHPADADAWPDVYVRDLPGA
jgi:Tol biopolymer transport system component